MLNSVARYLWGSSSDHEQDYTEKSNLEQRHGSEHLETQQDEDWVVVKAADKENSGQPSHHTPHHHHHHHHPPQHLHHHHPHAHSLPVASGQESLSQGSSEVELLDDAVSLAHSMASSDHHGNNSGGHTDVEGCTDPPHSPLQDCGMINFDLDSNYSSDTESSPESVFSACSGRSHATYRPHGNSSEPWVMAPPPCFTGSQAGDLTPIASSPLENLLIEHPSMSVYLSVPPSSLPPSHPFLYTHLTGEPSPSNLPEGGERGNNSQQQQQPADRAADQQGQVRADVAAIQVRNRTAQAAIHPAVASQQQLLQHFHAAQRIELSTAQKQISTRRCERQNKVREHHGCPSSKNKRNKRTRPSGCMAGRFNQRV